METRPVSQMKCPAARRLKLHKIQHILVDFSVLVQVTKAKFEVEPEIIADNE